MDRKKQLKEEYKQRKAPMGVFAIHSGDYFYIEATKDLTAAMNAARFKLNAGGHPHQGLQAQWKATDSNAWSIEILEPLEYDPEGLQEDYSEELAVLKMIWADRLTAEGKHVFQRN